MSNCCNSKAIDGIQDADFNDVNISGEMLLSDGSLTAPSLTFENDINTGLYRIGDDRLGLTVGGSLGMELSSTGAYMTGLMSSTDVLASNLIKASTGTVGAPSITFKNDLDTGMYNVGANQLGLTVGGSNILSLSSTGAYVTGNLQNTGIVKSQDGTSANPAYTFTNDPDTGIYRDSDGSVSIASNGYQKARISQASVQLNDELYVPGVVFSGTGAVNNPTISFGIYSNSGWYNIGANNIGLTLNSEIQANYKTTSVDFTHDISAGGIVSCSTGFRGADGTVDKPTYSFTSDTDTGFYLSGPGSIVTTIGNSLKYVFETNAFRPSSAADNTLDLGASNARFDDVWATNSVIQTSDGNRKDNIVDSDLGLDFLMNLKPRKYKFKDLPERVVKDESKNDVILPAKSYVRQHYGLVAQEVKETLDALNIDTNDFAGYIETSDGCGLRYTEFIPIIIKAIKELKLQIDGIKN